MPDTPDALRPPFRLRAALAVPAGWPPDVAPNQIITASHINAIKASVYAWPGDVDGQNHTLSNVHLVNATGVLADPTTTAGDLIARGATAIGRFAIGAAGQVLTVDLALPAKLKWATPAAAPVLSFNTRTGAVIPQAGDYTAAMITGALADPLTTKGDLIARGAVTGRMPVGTDGQVLRVDSAQVFGLRWAGESVPSVFGRSGAPIIAQAGDYTASQVTNAVSTIATYPDPAWITSLSWFKLIGVPTTFAPAAHTHAAADIVSGVLATARLGTGVADATVYLRGDGTWAAAGTGGGGGVVSVFGRAGNVVAQSGDYTAAMVTGALSNPTTTTGDLIVRNNLNAMVRLPIGANGQLLQTDTSLSTGMKWTTITAAVQTPWVTNIDAANFDLVNVHRIGVGVAVPNYPIDVLGDINYTGTLRVNGVPVTFGGSQTPWTSDINAANFKLHSVNSIGIGLAPPLSAPLHVASHTPGSTGSVAVQDLDAGAGGNPVLLFTGMGSDGSRCWAVGNRGGATYGQDFYLWNDRASAMLFGTNSAERMRITSAGLVGIGTTNPQYQLDLGGTTGKKFAMFNNGSAFFGLGITTGFMDFWAPPTGGHIFHVNETTEAMRITPAGNVGIGTTNPQAVLTASANFNGAKTLLQLDNANGSPTSTELRLDFSAIGTVPIARIAAVYPAPSNVGLAFSTFGSGGLGERVRIDKEGNVGIGTTNPQSLLMIAGPQQASAAAATQFRITEPSGNVGFGISIGVFADTIWKSVIQSAPVGTGASALLLNPNGSNVGIATVTPGYKLDVAGDVNCTGVFRNNGAVISQITVVTNFTGSKVLNGVYQNNGGKPWFITVTATISSVSYIKLLADGGNPPTVTICSATNAAGGGTTIGGTISGWILPGWFYKVDTGGATLISWLEYN